MLFEKVGTWLGHLLGAEWAFVTQHIGVVATALVIVGVVGVVAYAKRARE
jgi:hypothetical protein